VKSSHWILAAGPLGCRAGLSVTLRALLALVRADLFEHVVAEILVPRDALRHACPGVVGPQLVFDADGAGRHLRTLDPHNVHAPHYSAGSLHMLFAGATVSL
jgi:hypothetical protein